jgi:hypothetical protein
MSYDLPRESLNLSSRPASDGVDERARLCGDIADGLHALAQPLTILRGALGALALRERIAPQNSRYLDMSTRQIERMCDLISRIQKRLDLERPEASQRHNMTTSSGTGTDLTNF